MSRVFFSTNPLCAFFGFTLSERRCGMPRSSRMRADCGMTTRETCCFMYAHKATASPRGWTWVNASSSPSSFGSRIERRVRVRILARVSAGCEDDLVPFLEMMIAFAVVEKVPDGNTPTSDNVPSPLSFRRQAKWARC